MYVHAHHKEHCEYCLPLQDDRKWCTDLVFENVQLNTTWHLRNKLVKFISFKLDISCHMFWRTRNCEPFVCLILWWARCKFHIYLVAICVMDVALLILAYIKTNRAHCELRKATDRADKPIRVWILIYSKRHWIAWRPARSHLPRSSGLDSRFAIYLPILSSAQSVRKFVRRTNKNKNKRGAWHID